MSDGTPLTKKALDAMVRMMKENDGPPPPPILRMINGRLYISRRR